MHQFPAEVMPLEKSSGGGGGGLNWCPPTTEFHSLRPGLGLRSPIVECKNRLKA